MKSRIISPAIEEIADAALWLDSQSPGLGHEFWRLVDHSLCEIEANPQRFAKSDFASADLDLRYTYVERFRHIIHFLIEPDEVVIIAVSHAAR